MKLLATLLMAFSANAFALDSGDIGDLIGGLIRHEEGGQFTPAPDQRWPGRPGRPERPGRPGRPGWPGDGGYGDLYCTAVDAGWEEHRGGHASCGECLALHGDCNETCQRIVQFSQCIYEGRDRRGVTENYIGRGYDRREAERDAYRQCSSYYRDCRFIRCDNVDERSTVSQGSCRRRGRW